MEIQKKGVYTTTVEEIRTKIENSKILLCIYHYKKAKYILQIKSHFIPRVGESISIEEMDYKVKHVSYHLQNIKPYVFIGVK